MLEARKSYTFEWFKMPRHSGDSLSKKPCEIWKFTNNIIIDFLTPGLNYLKCTVFNIFRRSNKNQSTLSAHEKKEMKLAIMLMIVVVVFLICNM